MSLGGRSSNNSGLSESVEVLEQAGLLAHLLGFPNLDLEFADKADRAGKPDQRVGAAVGRIR